ncbi:hypothetical protein lerEdw1_000905, partial [Lerista edwardsae]
MQSYLARNQVQESLPKEESQSHPDITSSEQVVKDMCQSVQDYIKMLSSVQDAAVQADILRAEDAIEDANLSIDQILPFLSKAGSTPYQNGKLKGKLESLVGEVSQICSREIQGILHTTVDTVQSLCPKTRQRSHVWDHVIHSVPEKALLDQLLTEVYGKFMWVPDFPSPPFFSPGTPKRLFPRLAAGATARLLTAEHQSLTRKDEALLQAVFLLENSAGLAVSFPAGRH